jgi:hypothetical protein
MTPGAHFAHKRRKQEMAKLEEKMGKLTRTELMEHVFKVRVEDIVMYSKILLEQLGKEKAIELVKKARWDARYGKGKETAEKLGNPKDVHAYYNALEEAMAKIPYVRTPSEIVERTKNRIIFRTTKCFLSDAILARNLDKDLMDVVREYCNHDEGWAAGFNPDMKFERVKFLVDGDDSCQFLCEVK